MPKLFNKIRKIAVPPGTLMAVEGTGASKITVIDYNVTEFQQRELKNLMETAPYRDTPTISWINVDGRDVEVIRHIGEYFGVHPLVLEDIVDLGQRPKVEDYGDYLFFIVKMIYHDKKTLDLYAEQIGLVLSDNFVISFQEKEGDVFDPIRLRIKEAKGRVRTQGADYLAYCLLDAIVDNYFAVLEKIGEDIDRMEKEMLEKLDERMPLQIHRLKTKIIYLRKQIWPLREVLSGLQRSQPRLIKKTTEIYLRDVYDHTIQVNDTLEAFRDAISGMHDVYLSGMSNKMNEIMKVLTIFSAIFIPLTFVAGVYGMNFENMPELRWRYSYFVVIGIMAILGFGMLFYFKKRKWI